MKSDVFDLNKGVASWRREMRRRGISRSEDLDELEAHLRDRVDALIAGGVAEEEAFGRAVEELGDVEAMSKELARVRCEAPVRARILDDGSVIMNPDNGLRSAAVPLLSLFLGFSALVACVGTVGLTVFLGLGHFASVDRAILVSLCLWCAPLTAGGAWLLRRGFQTWRRKAGKTRFLATAALAAVFLAPVYGFFGVWGVMLTPVWWASATQPPDIVQAALSPDGKYEAYVENKPSVDGPNHHLFVWRPGEKKAMRIARLLEDTDWVKEIVWSPHSDIVVFRSHMFLTAAQATGGEPVQIPIGPKLRRRKSGTFTLDGKGVVPLAEIDFPEPGRFRYRFKGSDAFETIEIGEN